VLEAVPEAMPMKQPSNYDIDGAAAAGGAGAAAGGVVAAVGAADAAAGVAGAASAAADAAAVQVDFASAPLLICLCLPADSALPHCLMDSRLLTELQPPTEPGTEPLMAEPVLFSEQVRKGTCLCVYVLDELDELDEVTNICEFSLVFLSCSYVLD
jgi:hypothetical protein